LTGGEGSEVNVLTVGTQAGVEGGEVSNKVGLQDGARKKDTFSRNLIKARFLTRSTKASVPLFE
jgi:hypothetical protein